MRVDELWAQLPRLAAIIAPLQVHLQETEPTADHPGQPAGVSVHAEASMEALKPLSSLVEAALQKSIDELRSDLLNTLSDVKGELGTKATELKVDVTQLQDKVDRWARSPQRAKLVSAQSSAPSARWVPPGANNRSTMISREKATAAAMASAESQPTCHTSCKSPSSPDVPVTKASAKDMLARSTGRLPVLGR